MGKRMRGIEARCVYNQLIPLLSVHVQTKKVRQCSTVEYSSSFVSRPHSVVQITIADCTTPGAALCSTDISFINTGAPPHQAAPTQATTKERENKEKV